jgi:transcription-repair coupling factor (superfamily II helicase)
LPHAVTNLLTCAAIRLAAAHAGISDVEIKEQKLILTRHSKLVMVQGKFPRLKATLGYKQLKEALEMVRSL